MCVVAVFWPYTDVCPRFLDSGTDLMDGTYP